MPLIFIAEFPPTKLVRKLSINTQNIVSSLLIVVEMPLSKGLKEDKARIMSSKYKL
jgi:hypothetical protein